MIRKIATTTAALAILLVGTHASAGANDATCTAWEIRASSAASPKIDRELKHIRELRKGAFRQFNTFEKIRRHNISIQHSHNKETSLTPGKLSLVNRGVEAKEGRKPRVRLDVAIDSKKGKRLISIRDMAMDRDAFWMYVDDGLKIAKGTFVLALTCQPKK